MTINFSCPSVSVFYGGNKTNREKLEKVKKKLEFTYISHNKQSYWRVKINEAMYII